MAIKTIIMGAAGRDFHNFNMVYRNNPTYEVVAFTATRFPTSMVAFTPPSWPERATPRESR